ncbi:MAG TPA: DNA polymerase III subunit delta [Verrucomicrobiota bacterium]|nr:DNA polymerase III subunit delta [Verrucomicrobiota bacterium]HRR63264.1 DNA polymerase III subunit delta [Candidatus Paceibacterota bacterium]NLH85135.1 DNA polymerase III subunit delta [Verrucomicrobiota bacterium]HNR71713.1 DNA polymerase III subunit delta [Verrucomicrobiota bacterium]HNS69967.1 DNA polymerase III subunit delta [Verrucomicrobiota bacterium]
MPPPAAQPAASLKLVCGEDDFVVKQRARQIHQQWTAEVGGMDHETIDASVTTKDEAFRALAKLREALQTLPFFGSGKVIWFKDCNFLSDERAATPDVTEALAELARELKEFAWANVRLLISAGKVDKRKAFYKTLDKLGAVESFAGWSADDPDWAEQAEAWARQALRARQKEISDEALAELVSRVGPHSGLLDSEIEKVSLYVGERREIGRADVAAICTRNKTARAFALGDALGDRDLPRLLARLDEALWEVKLDRQKTEIGLLYGLIYKVRAMLLLKELLREGWIQPDANFSRFKAQLERIPAGQLPEDKRFNPRSLHPFMLFKALPQVKRYRPAELVRAMDLLFECNLRLVSSGLEESLVLQQALVQIVSPPASPPRPEAARARPAAVAGARR